MRDHIYIYGWNAGTDAVGRGNWFPQEIPQPTNEECTTGASTVGRRNLVAAEHPAAY